MADESSDEVRYRVRQYRRCLATGSKADTARDWNSEFQQIMDRLNDDRILEEEQMWIDLTNLANDFTTAARSYGKIIIEEQNWDDNDKTIKSLRGLGIAGGNKYTKDNIFFKFASDDRGLYGEDELAAKAGGQELLATAQVMSHPSLIHSLRVPLITLIDYRGSRLIAMPNLPVSKDTLVYGSSDACTSIINSDPTFNELMKIMANRLNLSPHELADAKGKLTTLYGPFDLEGHKGTDGRYYALDFARLMPPAPCAPGRSNCALFQMLRPELVRRSENPLCSDAYSKRSSGNEIQRREIKIIYNRLLKDDVPAFARWLCNKLEDISQRDRSIESVIKNLLEAQKQSLCSSSNSDSFASSWNDNGSDTSDSEYLAGDSTSEQRQRRGAVKATKRLYHEFSRLKTLSHHFGINLRLLGHVRSAVPKRSLWRSVVLAECSCRTLKNLHRKDLRALAWKLRFQQHRQVVEPLFRQEALRFFNTVFGETPASSSFWEEIVRKGLTERFPDVLEKAEKAPLKSMVRQLLPYIAINLAAYLGYSLSDNIAQQLYDTTSFSLLARERPFSESDLEMREKIKQLPLISYGEGTVALIQLVRLQRTAGDQVLMKQLAERAKQKFHSALENDYDHPMTLANLSFVMDAYYNEIEEAMDLLIRSTRANPFHTRSWYYLARLYERMYDMRRHSMGTRGSNLRKGREADSTSSSPTHSNAALGQKSPKFSWSQHAANGLSQPSPSAPLSPSSLPSVLSVFSPSSAEQEKRRNPQKQSLGQSSQLLLEEAKQCYERVVKVSDGKHANGLKDYGNFMSMRMWDDTEAERLYRSCLEAEPTHFRCLRNLAQLLLNKENVASKPKRDGYYDEVLQLLFEAIAHPPHFQAAKPLKVSKWKLYDLLRVKSDLAMGFGVNANTDHSNKECMRVISTPAGVSSVATDCEESLVCLRISLQLLEEKDKAYALVPLADVHWACGDATKALLCLKAALSCCQQHRSDMETPPLSAVVRRCLARWYSAQGDRKAAVAMYEKVLASPYKDDPNPTIEYAEYLWDQQSNAEAAWHLIKSVMNGSYARNLSSESWSALARLLRESTKMFQWSKRERWSKTIEREQERSQRKTIKCRYVTLSACSRFSCRSARRFLPHLKGCVLLAGPQCACRKVLATLVRCERPFVDRLADKQELREKAQLEEARGW